MTPIYLHQTDDRWSRTLHARFARVVNSTDEHLEAEVDVELWWLSDTQGHDACWVETADTLDRTYRRTNLPWTKWTSDAAHILRDAGEAAVVDVQHKLDAIETS